MMNISTIERLIDKSGQRLALSAARRRSSGFGQDMAKSAAFCLARDFMRAPEMDGKDYIRFIRLCEAIADAERMEAPKYAWGNLALCVREQCELLAPLLLGNRVSLEMSLPDVLYCAFDRTMTGRLLLSLFLGASRFAPPDGVISIFLVTDAGGSHLNISGCGRWEGAELWLIRELVHSYGGGAGERAAGRYGSVFTVTLPVAKEV